MNKKDIITVLGKMAEYKICSMCGNLEEVIYFIDNGSCILDNSNILAIVNDNFIEINSITESFLESNMSKLFIEQITELQDINNKMFNSKKVDLLLALASDEVASFGEKRNSINLANNIMIKLYNAI